MDFKVRNCISFIKKLIREFICPGFEFIYYRRRFTKLRLS